MSKATLVLENGSCYEGVSAGAEGERIGEVVLNTAVVGYQEMMTDPANAGKILVLTYPLIGNYGIASKFNESKKCWLGGLVIKEASRIYSNYQAEGPISGLIRKEDLAVISEVDTRTLAVDIRDNGEMLGMISTEKGRKEDLLKRVKDHKAGKSFIRNISVKKPLEIKAGSSGPSIAVLDLGTLNSIVAQLATLGCNLTLLPYNTPAEEILAMRPDGLIISGGPEDDEAMPGVAETVKALFAKVPMLGISAGHEAIALALGARLKRLKIGHRGVNYPVKGPGSFKGDITVQNHSFIVDETSIKGRKDINILLRNINDGSIEAMESKPLRFFSVQYYPSSPGFNEVNAVFGKFLDMIKPKAAKQRHAVKPAGEVQYAKA